MSEMRSGDNWLDLADAVELLRVQVIEAQQRAIQRSELTFEVNEITLEFGVELCHTQGHGANLRFGVVGFDSKRDEKTVSTHKVALKLQPKRVNGSSVEIVDKEQG